MSAEHNHAPRCCCLRIADGEVIERCSACPEHGDLAGIPRDNIWRGTALESVETMLAAAEEPAPYTEQETTNG